VRADVACFSIVTGMTGEGADMCVAAGDFPAVPQALFRAKARRR